MIHLIALIVILDLLASLAIAAVLGFCSHPDVTSHQWHESQQTADPQQRGQRAA